MCRSGCADPHPRGTAVPGRSDLDAVLLLRELPTAADHDEVAGLARELDQRHAVIDGAGLLLWPVSRILDPAERYDLAGVQARLDGLAWGTDTARLCRQVARKLVRTGFTLVMPRWGGWTSSLDRMAAIFGRYYPHRAGAMAGAARLAVDPSSDPAVVAGLISGMGGWLAGEYGQAVGEKRAPR